MHDSENATIILAKGTKVHKNLHQKLSEEPEILSLEVKAESDLSHRSWPLRAVKAEIIWLGLSWASGPPSPTEWLFHRSG